MGEPGLVGVVQDDRVENEFEDSMMNDSNKLVEN